MLLVRSGFATFLAAPSTARKRRGIWQGSRHHGWSNVLEDPRHDMRSGPCFAATSSFELLAGQARRHVG